MIALVNLSSGRAAVSPQRSMSVQSHSSDENVDIFVDEAVVVVTESKKVYSEQCVIIMIMMMIIIRRTRRAPQTSNPFHTGPA